MTESQCRLLESYDGRPVRWPTHQIRAALSRWRLLVARLKAGERIDVGEDMGSCQCGHTHAEVYLRDGVVWCTSTGRMKWQRYDGPAAGCQVGCGPGRRARNLAAAYDLCQSATVAG